MSEHSIAGQVFAGQVFAGQVFAGQVLAGQVAFLKFVQKIPQLSDDFCRFFGGIWRVPLRRPSDCSPAGNLIVGISSAKCIWIGQCVLLLQDLCVPFIINQTPAGGALGVLRCHSYESGSKRADRKEHAHFCHVNSRPALPVLVI